MEIGTVISSETGPSSDEFWIVLNDNKGIPIRKHQFVQLKTEDGLLIARVSDIIKTNRYFTRAESVSEFERAGRPLMEQFPVDRWEYLIAKSIPLGIYSNGMQKRVSFPPSPGDKVYKADEKILSEFFGFDNKSGVSIGKVEFHDLDAKLNITKLFQKHLAVLAISGAGKSYTTSVLIEELLDRSEELGKPAIILFDPHGEYTGFADDENYITKTKVYSKDISVATSKLSIFNLGELIPQMSAVQRRELAPIIKTLREKKKSYTLFDLISEVESSNMNPKTKGALISWLADLNYTGLFKSSDSPSIGELAVPGQLSIFDFSELIHLKEKQMILTYFARKLFDARRQNKIPPFILIIEEAHQFAPGGELEELAISRGVVEQIAREGRKFNACLVLISQRPKRLATTALSQCNTNFILKVTNPIDLQHIAESCEGMTRDVLDIIPGLKVGEALIMGEAVNYPILVKVRERRSKKSDKGMKLEDALVKYRQDKKLRSEDLEIFQ